MMVIIDSIEIDTKDAHTALRQLQQHANITGRTVLDTAKKGYRTVALLAEIMGGAIPMMFSMIAEAGFMAAGMMTEIAAAESMTGWLAFKASMTFTMASMIFYRATQAQAMESEVKSQLGNLIQLGNLYS